MSRRPLIFYYTGCNVFGQVGDSSDLHLRQFVKFEAEGLIDVAIAHSVVAMVLESGTFLHGQGLQLVGKHGASELELPPGCVPKNIYTCDDRVFVLSEDNEVYFMNFIEPTLRNLECPLWARTKIQQLSFNVVMNVAVSEDQKIFVWQSNSFEAPRQVKVSKLHDETVSKISTGYEHCLLLTNKGLVYSMGNGRRGQLGHGDLDEQREPKIVEALRGISIVDVACGGWHSCAVGALGEVYTWGWNNSGQLGLGNADVQVFAEPQMVPFDPSINIKYAACGSRHTITASDDNSIYGFGCNRFGQLAMSVTAGRKLSLPTRSHQFPAEMQVVKVLCGPTSSGIVLC